MDKRDNYNLTLDCHYVCSEEEQIDKISGV